MSGSVTHEEPTVSAALLTLESRLERLLVDVELLRLAVSAIPTIELHTFTLCTNTVRRMASAMKVPAGTVAEMFAVPVPAFHDPKRPFVNWGQKSAVLWWAMRDEYEKVKQPT